MYKLVLLLTLASTLMVSGEIGPVVVLSDNFDDNTAVGATLFHPSNITPDIGLDWRNSTQTYTNLVVVQDTINNGGNALRITRQVVDETKQSPAAFLWANNNPTNIMMENSRVTLKADVRRENNYGTGAISILFNGTTTLNGPVIYIDPSSQILVYTHDPNGYQATGYNIGTGGWSTVEILLTWGETNASGQITGDYSVHLTRDADCSEGVLDRTLIASGMKTATMSAMYDYRIYVENQIFSTYTSVMYWDNMSLNIHVPDQGTIIGVQ